MQELKDRDKSLITTCELGKIRFNIRQCVPLLACLRICHDFLRHCQMELKNLTQHRSRLN
jgi:hypothetical protein